MNEQDFSNELSILRERTKQYRELLSAAYFIVEQELQSYTATDAPEGLKKFMEKCEEHGIGEEQRENKISKVRS